MTTVNDPATRQTERSRVRGVLAGLAVGGIAVAALLGGCATPSGAAGGTTDALRLLREVQTAQRLPRGVDLSAAYCRALLEFGYKADLLIVRFPDPATGRRIYHNIVRWQDRGGPAFLDAYSGQTYAALPRAWETVEVVTAARLYSDPRFADRRMGLGVSAPASGQRHCLASEAR